MSTIAPRTPTSLYLNSPIGRGPVLRRYRRRALGIWFTLALIGLLPSLLNLSPALQAAGLGLWLPGGGFIFTASPVYLVISLFVFVVSLVMWLLMGGFILPLIVWGGTMALAAIDSRHGIWPAAQVVTPLVALGVVGLVALLQRRSEQAAIPKAAALKTHLDQIPQRQPLARAHVSEPLSDADLGALRFTLDLALQPIDQFAGFVTIDQFREAAWRYQLVSINYALAMHQTCRAPAFAGYLHEAQRRAIIKMQDRRVWKYWRVENFVGNLRWDADPVKRENIMYSGWWGLAIGAYERVTGDLSFSAPGALTLTENANTAYVYDYGSMMNIVANNFAASDLCLYPCEPNWVFSICNLYGMTGLLMHDKVHNTQLGRQRLPQFNRIFEQEFTMAEGRAGMLISNRSGFVMASDTPLLFIGSVHLLNMTDPRMAQVYWETGKYLLKQKFGDDRNRWHELPALDAGNYQNNGTGTWTNFMRAAREMGDEDMFNFAKNEYTRMGVDDKDGAAHYQGSVLNQLTAHAATFANQDAWFRLANGDIPAAINSGPRLTDVPYPAVLVAGADNDGAQLEMVLCAAPVAAEYALTFDRLTPNGGYRLHSSEEGATVLTVHADAQGKASSHAVIGKRTRLQLVPDTQD